MNSIIWVLEIRWLSCLLYTSRCVYETDIVDSYMGNRFVIINETPTEFDSRADLVIRGRVEEVLGNI